MDITKFQEIIKSTNLDATLYYDSRKEWNRIIQNISYLPVYYLPDVIDYMDAYMVATQDKYYNLSIVINVGNNPVGVWPLCVKKNRGVWACGSIDREVIPPLFVKEFGDKGKKLVLERCLDLLDALCIAIGQNNWSGIETVKKEGVSHWHRKVMERGAALRATHELYVDLGLDLNTIWSSIRKSYRPLINKGLKSWQIEVYERIEHAIFIEFQNLHFKAAGRVTRPQSTWELQEKAINSGSAFLILLRDRDDNKVVGGGLFYYTKDEGWYAVGAYDRALFDQPLGHVVQMKAIEFMKSKGVKWYRIGSRPYPENNPSQKEQNIAYYKEGFATHFFLNTVTSSPVNRQP